MGPLPVGSGFRPLPLTSPYAFFVFYLIVEFLECDLPVLFYNGQMLTGLSIAPTPVQVEWTPSLHRATVSGGESWLVEVRPSPPVVVPSQPVISTAAVAEVMVVIPMAAEAGSKVTLAIPPPTAMEEERREIGLPASPGGGGHGSPS